MVGLLLQNRKGIEGTALCMDTIPDKSIFCLIFCPFLSFQALHLFTLTTEKRSIQTGIKIILLDPDG
jgi:hypothetical protein